MLKPEFLREGWAVQDTLKPSRIVIGPVDQFSRQQILLFYRRFYGKQMPPVVDTSSETAEMIKYASNAFLATKISFINLNRKTLRENPGKRCKRRRKGNGARPEDRTVIPPGRSWLWRVMLPERRSSTSQIHEDRGHRRISTRIYASDKRNSA